MDVYGAIMKRRSIREFRATLVAYADLEKCVDAARLAPTAMNCQLCEYVIVDDEKLLPDVLDTINTLSGVPRPEGGWSPERRPRAYIVALINAELEAQIGTGRTNTHFDVGLAVENMVLAALEQGLGSCVMTGIDRGRLRQLLNIAEKYEITMLVALGYPDENPLVEETDGPVKRRVDEKGRRHIPKRRLRDILHRNRLPA